MDNYGNVAVTFTLGRTIPSARMLMDLEIERIIRSYGRYLSSSDKALLYDALQLTKKHVDAFGESVRLVPSHAILMTVLLEQERQIQSLLPRLEMNNRHGK